MLAEWFLLSTTSSNLCLECLYRYALNFEAFYADIVFSHLLKYDRPKSHQFCGKICVNISLSLVFRGGPNFLLDFVCGMDAVFCSILALIMVEPRVYCILYFTICEICERSNKASNVCALHSDQSTMSVCMRKGY